MQRFHDDILNLHFARNVESMQRTLYYRSAVTINNTRDFLFSGNCISNFDK